MKKAIKVMALAIASTMLFATPVFADNWKWTGEKWVYENTEGDWKQTDGKWWYQYKNGGYPANRWKWIFDSDGLASCYYFDEAGWLVVNGVTPDGYTVNEYGAWTVDGVIQADSHPYEENPVQEETQAEVQDYLTEEEVRQREQEDNGLVDYTEGFTPGNGDGGVMPEVDFNDPDILY